MYTPITIVNEIKQNLDVHNSYQSEKIALQSYFKQIQFRFVTA